MSLTLLYHGTDIDSAKEICDAQLADVSRGSKKVDFGPGFYMTDDLARAKTWAYRKARVRKKQAALVSAYVDLDSARPIITRFEEDVRWARFVINNRNGMSYINSVMFKENNLDARYHITYGKIADYEVRSIADKLKEQSRMIDSPDYICNDDYAMQYAFHTKLAISYIKKYCYSII